MKKLIEKDLAKLLKKVGKVKGVAFSVRFKNLLSGEENWKIVLEGDL